MSIISEEIEKSSFFIINSNKNLFKIRKNE